MFASISSLLGRHRPLVGSVLCAVMESLLLKETGPSACNSALTDSRRSFLSTSHTWSSSRFLESFGPGLHCLPAKLWLAPPQRAIVPWLWVPCPGLSSAYSWHIGIVETKETWQSSSNLGRIKALWGPRLGNHSKPEGGNSCRVVEIRNQQKCREKVVSGDAFFQMYQAYPHWKQFCLRA